ncbi:GNAT family N-acetyltransferase [Corynebacterium sp. TA-R-1]|uniref:GNAT family N-acetyltransferase n=1 Tax=Corynebacterium stercoris TaxID=2943490 RepID=A0ABT1G118_9CORY|nr:GNAT family N-acetyltransferase [Corynebacterium stercoris]
MTVEIRRLTAGEYSLLVPTLVDIYIAAMEYNPAIRDQRIRVWRGEVAWPGFTAIAAVDGDDVVGVAYGFLGSRDRWWDRQLVRSMEESGGITHERQQILDSYFEVAEIHVAPGQQGRGIGAAMLAELLRQAPAAWALLSTPEVKDEANHAFSLYRRFGFVDVARRFLYPGDQRPFAILGRPLPLEL